MTKHVEGLSHLLLQVSDIEASEHFYCDLLGMEIRTRDTFGSDQRPLIVTHQGLGITLLPAKLPIPPAAEQRNVEHVAFWVTDLDSLVSTLLGEGIEVEGPTTNAYGRSIYAVDPDGYRVECIEP